MRNLAMLACVLLTVPLSAQAPTWTDAQLLQAERFKSALLQFQLNALALEQQRVKLQQQEQALSHDLCGVKKFELQTMTCVEGKP